MKIKAAWKRLEKGHFWQAVDEEHNRLIAEQLTDCREVLDLGCGYGTLTAYLTKAGIRAYGVDADRESIEVANQMFPALAPGIINLMDADSLDFSDNRFDGIVLRDTMHHLWEESNIEKTFGEIERVLKPGGRLVIFDPNPNLIVRTSRRIVKHQDAQCTYREASTLLSQRGWTIQRIFFSEFFALALSGGYVGVELTPKWPFLHGILLYVNRIASQLFSRMGLGPSLLWRYIIKAERQK